MEISLPVYVEVRRVAGQPVHHCRPLFFAAPEASDAHLGLALSKLIKRLKGLLDGFGGQSRHDRLAEWAFAPALRTHMLKLTLDLRDRQAKCKLLFITFAALERQVAFSPSLPQLWFEVGPGQSLEQRATAVLSNHYRQLEKSQRRSGEPAAGPESISLPGQAWVANVDLRVETRHTPRAAEMRKFAALFGEQQPNGEHELNRVGRCLDWLYPNELLSAVAREREAEELDRLLAAEDNRPVVLVGPRLSGKTSVLHECVRTRVARRDKVFTSKQNVWLLSPQRLIAGMMYVGQWETRVQAILRTARRRRHILYFDDFLGLYRAGISRDASLSVADVLKPFLLRRELRVLAEMTVETWQALQERDRGLADQFHVLRIAEMGDGDTRRVMWQVQRQLEGTSHCRFALETLPAVVQLQRSYVHGSAFPGKGAAFLRRLAEKHPQIEIGVSEVVEEFHRQTGLSLDLLDDRRRMKRESIVAQLRTKIVGQDEAVQAAADVVTAAKARLTPPGRPLATLLFWGPTGVGKTQCAKALAEVMFSGASRLLRFDMNEYGSPYAVAQLVGTFSEPDGLLTSAVRRQPFSVLLLDEIEKAHPDVFDLLLQVTGEGRLTDALGRTADFSSAVIVMTSNLGTKAGGGPIGLSLADASQRETYVKAAENFFRPEFFNRLDRIIPFETLSRDEMHKIAGLLLTDIFSRDGLVRRRCALSVEPSAMERIVDAGYHPQFGARALKRAIEGQLVHPVAASLAGVKPEAPAVIHVLPQPQGIATYASPLESVPTVHRLRAGEFTPDEELATARRFLSRAEVEIEASRPHDSSSSGIGPAQIYFYAVKEQLLRVRQLTDNLAESLVAIHSVSHLPLSGPKAPHQVKKGTREHRGEHRFVREIHAAQDIHAYLHDAASLAPRPEKLQDECDTLRNEAALLESMRSAAGGPDQVFVSFRPLSAPAQPLARRLALLLRDLVEQLAFDCDCRLSDDDLAPQGLRIAGPGIWPLAIAEAGVHVFCRQHENLLPVQVSVTAATDGSATDQVAALVNRRQQWLDRLATGQLAAAEDPDPLGPLVRLYDEAGPTLDLRSGLSVPGFPSWEQLKWLLLSGFALPQEWEA